MAKVSLFDKFLPKTEFGFSPKNKLANRFLGIMKNKKGLTQYEGLWEGGEPHGSGKCYNKKGRLTYEGPFRNGKSADGVHWETYKNCYLQSISING
jgi:antitoxin component YwqK of YwqJK toxin-antitoxin module